MKKRSNLGNLENDHQYKKVYIKNESSPLAKKEDDRLFTRLRKLKTEDPENERLYKIRKRKLLKGNEIIDEFDVTKSLFQ